MQAHVEETLRRKDKYPTTIYIDMDKFKAAYKEAGNKLPKDYPKAYIDEENGVPQPQAAMVIANPQTGVSGPSEEGVNIVKTRMKFSVLSASGNPGHPSSR